MTHKEKRNWLVAGGILVLAAVAVAIWWTGLLPKLASVDSLAGTMRRDGWRGPVICVAVQFAQVVIFLIPGEITQLAAGYVFGAWNGFLYSVTGIVLGSAFNYFFARLAGRPLMERILRPSLLGRVDALLNSHKGRTALFLLFLMPAMPKDAMSYGAGLTRLGFGEFLVLSSLGRVPALFFSTLAGSRLYHRDYLTFALTVVAGLIVVGIFFWWQRRTRFNDPADAPE